MLCVPKKNKGFSLVEILLVLGVIALLAIAAFVIYPRVRMALDIQQERSNLMTLQSGIRSVLSTQNGDYTALGAIEQTAGNLLANRAKVTPIIMNGGDYSGSNIVNSWGGNVIIHSTIGEFEGYARGRAFGIQYNNVPKDACVQFVLGTISGFTAAWINGNTGAGNYFTAKNATPERVTERCQLQDRATIHFVSI